jgi:K+-sensing histidine kinase KdpD
MTGPASRLTSYPTPGSASRAPTSPEPKTVSASDSLGLAIVRTIAETHGGQAQAANRASGGADVWITLPQVAGRAAYASTES